MKFFLFFGVLFIVVGIVELRYLWKFSFTGDAVQVIEIKHNQPLWMPTKSILIIDNSDDDQWLQLETKTTTIAVSMEKFQAELNRNPSATCFILLFQADSTPKTGALAKYRFVADEILYESEMYVVPTH